MATTTERKSKKSTKKTEPVVAKVLRRDRVNEADFAYVDASQLTIDPRANYRWGTKAAMLDDLKSDESAALRTSIAQMGVRDPIHVVRTSKDKYSVRNNFSRAQIAKDLGIKRVPVLIYEDDEDDSKLEWAVRQAASNKTSRDTEWGRDMALLETIEKESGFQSADFKAAVAAMGNTDDYVRRQYSVFRSCPASVRKAAKNGDLDWLGCQVFLKKSKSKDGDREPIVTDSQAKTVLKKVKSMGEDGTDTRGRMSKKALVAQISNIVAPEQKTGQTGTPRPAMPQVRALIDYLMESCVIEAALLPDLLTHSQDKPEKGKHAPTIADMVEESADSGSAWLATGAALANGVGWGSAQVPVDENGKRLVKDDEFSVEAKQRLRHQLLLEAYGHRFIEAMVGSEWIEKTDGDSKEDKKAKRSRRETFNKLVNETVVSETVDVEIGDGEVTEINEEQMLDYGFFYRLSRFFSELAISMGLLATNEEDDIEDEEEIEDDE